MDINNFRFEEWKELLTRKYGKDYLSAIAKLSSSTAYNGDGTLKEDYILTEQEHQALLKQHEEPYRAFIKKVERYTEETATLYGYNKKEDETWQIVGIEYKNDILINEYGISVYRKASKEVPMKENSYERDFEHASRKLARLVHEGISTSMVLDLDLLQESLANMGIPSYIDYEQNIFHFNAKREVKMKTSGIYQRARI